MLADQQMPLLIPVIIALVLLAGFIWIRTYEGEADQPQEKPSFLLIAGLFLVVIIRSFAGFSWQLPWKAEHLVFMTAAVVAGKMLGGILADAIGTKKTAILSLALSFLCFIKADWILTGLLSVLFFNMTMPICLKQITLEMKNQSGFAFGLLTFALFIGYLPSTFGISTVSNTLTLILIAVSLIMMFLLRSDAHD